jgi:ABC-type glutathione transport system ATPase component
MHADKIFVLEKGVIVETGKHEELLSEKGLYYAMWRQQIGERRGQESEKESGRAGNRTRNRTRAEKQREELGTEH